MRALIIDDSGVTRSIIRRMLVSLGFEDIAEAGNGREALDVVSRSETPFNLALVDWHMPVMAGLEFIMSIRQRPHLNTLKMVVVSVDGAPGEIERALEAGADEYIMKPFDVEVLRDKLRIIGVE